MSKDHGKLKAVFRLLEPGLVYVDGERKLSPALATLGEFDFDLVSSAQVKPAGPIRGGCDGSKVGAAVNKSPRRAEAFESLLAAIPGPEVDAAYAAVAVGAARKVRY